jgi:CheY-like chemotaxis protein
MKTKVLIVEDEPLLLMMAVDLFEDAGFEALEASNADDAIVLLAGMPDVRIVVTDIDMPGSMDGLKLAKAVRNRWPPIEIIVVSGKQRPAVEDLPARAVFMSKPYNTDVLLQTASRMAA